MAWRDFYNPGVNESTPLQSLSKPLLVEQAVQSMVPIVPVNGEAILHEQMQTPLPTITLAAKDGAACAIPVSAMPAPVATDASRLCENVRRFL